MAKKHSVEIILKSKDQTKGGFKSANQNVKDLERGSAGMSKKMVAGFLAVGVAVVAASAKIQGMIKEVTEIGDAMDKMSKRTDLSVDVLARWSYSIQLAGGSASNLEAGVRRMTKSMYDAQQGLSTATRAFKNMGVEYENADGSLRSVNETLLDLAEALSKMDNKTEKLAASQDILGRGAAQLVVMLEQGRRELEAQGREYDNLHGSMKRTATAGAELTDAMLRLKAASSGKTEEFFTPMIEKMTGFVNHSAKVVSAIDSMGDAAKTLGWMTGVLTDDVLDFSVTFNGLTPKELAEEAQNVFEFGMSGNKPEMMPYLDEEMSTVLNMAEVVNKDLSVAWTAVDEAIMDGLEAASKLEEQTYSNVDAIDDLTDLAYSFKFALESATSSMVFDVLTGKAKNFGDVIQSFVMPMLSQVITKLIMIKVLSPFLGFEQGGTVPQMAKGGSVPAIPKAAFGYSVPDGPRGVDSRMIMAMPGEEVINRGLSRRLNRFLSASESSTYASPWGIAGGGQGGSSTVVMNVGIPQTQAGIIEMQRGVSEMLDERDGGRL